MIFYESGNWSCPNGNSNDPCLYSYHVCPIDWSRTFVYSVLLFQHFRYLILVLFYQWEILVNLLDLGLVSSLEFRTWTVCLSFVACSYLYAIGCQPGAFWLEGCLTVAQKRFRLSQFGSGTILVSVNRKENAANHLRVHKPAFHSNKSVPVLMRPRLRSFATIIYYR